MAKIPLKGLVEREVLKLMEQMYAADGGETELSKTGGEGGGAVQRFVERHGDRIFGAIERVKGARDRFRAQARKLLRR
jgi:hypothetical protein